jgi:hypothetical protein
MGMAYRLHIETTVAKALGTYMRTYSMFKSKHLSTNIKLIVFRALIRSIMTYACLTWELAADIRLMKLQGQKNRVLCSVGDFVRHTAVHDSHVTFKIPYVYDYIPKLCRRQAAVIQIMKIQMYMLLDKKPGIGNIRGFSCHFGGLNKLSHSLLYKPALTEDSVYIRI